MNDRTCGHCSDAPMLTAEALEMLERHHDFPGLYMFKVIGFAAEGFAEDVCRAVGEVLDELDCGRHMRHRHSSGGKYLAVTVEVEVSEARQVLEVYESLRTVQGVVTIV